MYWKEFACKQNMHFAKFKCIWLTWYEVNICTTIQRADIVPRSKTVPVSYNWNAIRFQAIYDKVKLGLTCSKVPIVAYILTVCVVVLVTSGVRLCHPP